ncbi:MAG: hypothetical protein AAB450_00690 [Patescibacteria group bacterium]
MQKPKENSGTPQNPSMYVASSDSRPLPRWVKVVAGLIVIVIAVVIAGGRLGLF